MDKLTVDGIPAYNGTYDIDLSYFTNAELHLIKKETGLRAGELSEAFAAGDNDLMVAIAAIAIWRKNRDQPNMAPLWDAESGKFTFEMAEAEDEPEDDSLPPQTGPGEPATIADANESDGLTSSDDSDRQANDLKAIGVPG